MSLKQAVWGLIVMAAVLFGSIANASAHAGHGSAHSAAMSAAHWSVAARNTASAGMSVHAPSVASTKPVGATTWIKSAPGDSGGDVCPSGTCCCCQAQSSCGMGGHCCSSMTPDTPSWFSDLSDQTRYHLARLNLVYPDIFIGLDRPPKA